MTSLLPSLLSAGLIEKMDGSDERFAKLKNAAAALAKALQSQPHELMRALLAALDPAIPPTDPSMQRAKAALTASWETIGGIYTDEPVNLYRSLLLEACNQCAKGMNAMLLWLVAADSLGFYRLGKEEQVVRQFLQELGRKAEEVAIQFVPNTVSSSKDDEASANFEFEHSQVENTDRKSLLMAVAAALGPDYRGNSIKNSNPNWQSRQSGHYGGAPIEEWNYQCADKLSVLLADELDRLAKEMQQGQEEFAEHMQSFLQQTQRQAIQSAITDHEHYRRTEQLRLDALWWSEALYSPALGQSYRELKPEVAALVMAQDLLQVVSLPTPASVAHLLAETVQRLPNAGYEIKKPIGDWLEQVRQCADKPTLDFVPVPKDGRLSLRDVFAWAISDQTWDSAKALQRAGIESGHEISLPALARALFRQEQACRLANTAKVAS